MKRIGLMILFLLIAYFIFLIRQDIIDYLDLSKVKEHTLNAIDREKLSAQHLGDRLRRLRSDDLVEEIARTKLGLIEKGETAFKVIR